MLYRQLLFHYHNDIELNLIKIRLINFDFGKLLKILRVFADDVRTDSFYNSSEPWHFVSSLPTFNSTAAHLESITRSYTVDHQKLCTATEGYLITKLDYRTDRVSIAVILSM